jgi:Flp pilus assembly protein TadG
MDIKNQLFRDERGSISLVVITLFLVSVMTALVTTDIASIAIAKRSLTQATEAAAQRGVRNLDLRAYYSGEFDLTTMASNLFGIGPKDPGVPIDCSKALGDVQGALADWSSGEKSLRRGEITALRINEIRCDDLEFS